MSIALVGYGEPENDKWFWTILIIVLAFALLACSGCESRTVVQDGKLVHQEVKAPVFGIHYSSHQVRK